MNLVVMKERNKEESEENTLCTLRLSVRSIALTEVNPS